MKRQVNENEENDFRDNPKLGDGNPVLVTIQSKGKISEITPN